MTLSSSALGTKTTFMMDYDLPYSIFGKIIDKLRVCKAVEKGAERGLLRLKEIAEMDDKNPNFLKQDGFKKEVTT
jgi:hypothetical protein